MVLARPEGEGREAETEDTAEDRTGQGRLQ